MFYCQIQQINDLFFLHISKKVREFYKRQKRFQKNRTDNETQSGTQLFRSS